MHNSRRRFLGAAAGVFASAVLSAAEQQQRPPEQGPSNPRIPLGGEPPMVPDAPKPDNRALKANQETVKKDVARILELAQELQDGVTANNTADILSLDLLKKCDELEKLTKQVRTLVRG